ncbi:hypothetical protein RHABOEDO_001058 [Candidatus Rhabdochlamydia oedothoracis]|uniref:Ubiquitin-like protease family profile domain-containing protein n=1 Tax=Candidatus Rhabdochlamydia oedothoracis TaxID=2720720 RepID=A0ABX8V740_9BACT|nr:MULTISPECIES: Ulp1 family isopeptidase [Rhabdochlamydia]KAG6558650.1 hypothetical protein RHOW815_001357 [Candidatus Rhabdochlamydia sp. W815]QYF48833.1 hypothetical protein RHABOEDO_001058 [Candidatus Rhabdochlamydia oedothoracis]
MKINQINNKQSFIFNPLKIIQSLGWVAVAILTLPTVIGSYFAWKKLVAIWSKNERPDTQKTAEVASETLVQKTLDKNNLDLDEEEDFVDMLSENLPKPLEVKKEEYERVIAQFESSGCLGPSSAEVYLDYLKNINPAFHFNMRLLNKLRPSCNEFLKTIEVEVKEAKEKNGSLFFVPFLLAGNFLREQHIVVAVINLKDEKIEYFDPKGNRVYSIFVRSVDRNLAEWNEPTQKFLEELSKALFPDQNPSIIRNINYPQSLWNRVDCGAHALEFIEKRLSADSLEQASSSLTLDGRQLRRELAHTLKESLKNQSLKT